jgi:mono/diheme cytochrome c family protein
MRIAGVQWTVFACLVGVLALAGCGGPALELKFTPHEKTVGLIEVARSPIQSILDEKFGSPAKPAVWKELPIDFGEASSDKSAAKAEGWRIHKGRDLYMVHCVHCHGTTGDGLGPTARFLNPRPRDYRQGVFKFTSTHGGMRPSRLDLIKVLDEGIPGTSMPSFVLLGTEQVELLVDYVRWLSMRGELEIKLTAEVSGMGGDRAELEKRADEAEEVAKLKTAWEEARKAAAADGGKKPAEEAARQAYLAARTKGLEPLVAELKETIDGDFPDISAELMESVVAAWTNSDSDDSLVTPKQPRTPPTEESFKRGQALFVSQKAKCADCHGPAGQGNGLLTLDYWPRPGVTPEQKYEVAGLHDTWGNPQAPRNLTRGQFRGGRRPVDVYRRLFVGVKGTQMTGYGSALEEAEIWDLVNYVMALPHGGVK